MAMDARVRGAAVITVVMMRGAALAEPAPVLAASPPESPAAPAAPVAPPGDPPSSDPPSSSDAGAGPRFQWEPFGYLRLQYRVVRNDPNVAFVGRDDGFELQNARVGVRGSLAGRIGFAVAFDGAIDERLQLNTPRGELRVALRDAFGDVALGGALVARAGLFQALVDPEAMVADTRRDPVDRPIESRGVRATEGFQAAGLTAGRSLGAAIRWDPEAPVTGVAIGFELAVQNGADEFSSNNDNDRPAVSATLIARLPHDGWVMAAGRFNPRTVGELPFRQDEDDLQGMAGVRVALGPVVASGGIVIQRTSFATTGGPRQNAFGGHGQAMLAVPVAVPLAVGYRFGILDPSSLITTDRVMEHTAGAVLGVPRLRARVQLQVTHVVEQAARELSNDRVQLAAELTL